MYIYKLGPECDGAQTRASDVYIPTLVALLGLCFDPSECFQDLCIWSGVVGNKSSKLRYMLQIVTYVLISAFFLTQLVSSVIAAWADWGFSNIQGVDSTWIGIIWVWV